jgi:YHS domain-containing protein
VFDLTRAERDTPAQEGAMETDPVCGMQVETTVAAPKAEYLGTTYYFCSAACHKAFSAEPQRYAKAAAHEPKPVGDTKHRS